jgi:hypothetical protein
MFRLDMFRLGRFFRSRPRQAKQTRPGKAK